MSDVHAVRGRATGRIVVGTCEPRPWSEVAAWPTDVRVLPYTRRGEPFGQRVGLLVRDGEPTGRRVEY